MEKRITKELNECHKDKKSGVTFAPVGDSLADLQGSITGPADTPYAGGKYFIEIKIPEQYPFTPPKMRFITKVWHPNISSQTGAICLDILKDNWTPALTIKTALISLQALLCAPQPDDPQDAQVASMYLDNFDEWERHAREWTRTYASGAPPEPEIDPKVKQIMEMGFNQEVASKALADHNGNLDNAVNQLLSG